jgi:glyoxylase-like metal-dependent hydrolase (beta-lactamase superfamily II)
MYRKTILSLMFTFAFCTIGSAQEAKVILESTIKNMGDVKSIQYSGSGAQFNLGQSVTPGDPWPRAELKRFTRTVDYEKLAARNEAEGSQGPLATQFFAGGKAWNVSSTNVTTAQLAAVTDRQIQIWLTPHGFLRGALTNKGTVKRGKVTTVTYTVLGKYRLVGTISADNLVEKVETWVYNPVLGDMHVETTYSDYRQFGGFRFPARIIQKQGGHPVLDLTVTEAKTDQPLDVAVPEQVLNATPPAVTVKSEKLSDGVWHVAGGSHHSVLVEFSDHIALIEAPLNEERSLAVIAEVKKLVPAKPIRYLVNTHYHFDHSGGLRTYVAEGATIVTHESNKAFYEVTFKAPHTLNPDRQWREKKKAKILAVGAKHVMSDGSRTMELHHIQGNQHNTGFIMAWLPAEKLLVEVDAYTPQAADAAPPRTPNPFSVNLYENIERLKLDVDRIAALHGQRVATIADLRKTIGK